MKTWFTIIVGFVLLIKPLSAAQKATEKIKDTKQKASQKVTKIDKQITEQVAPVAKGIDIVLKSAGNDLASVHPLKAADKVVTAVELQNGVAVGYNYLGKGDHGGLPTCPLDVAAMKHDAAYKEAGAIDGAGLPRGDQRIGVLVADRVLIEDAKKVRDTTKSEKEHKDAEKTIEYFTAKHNEDVKATLKDYGGHEPTQGEINSFKKIFDQQYASTITGRVGGLNLPVYGTPVIPGTIDLRNYTRSVPAPPSTPAVPRPF